MGERERLNVRVRVCIDECVCGGERVEGVRMSKCREMRGRGRRRGESDRESWIDGM